MYSVKISHHFDAAHFLSEYNGKCSNLHGHRWKVEVTVQSECLSTNGNNKGMVVDFTDIKKSVEKEIEKYDHSLIVETGSLNENTIECLKREKFKLLFVDFKTTAENFAYSIFSAIQQNGYNVKCVTVYETPNNSASYEC